MEDKIELDIVLIPEKKGKSKIYSIYSVQVPNVVTQGDSIENAKEMLVDALKLYFEEVPGEKERIIKIEQEQDAPLIGRMFF